MLPSKFSERISEAFRQTHTAVLLNDLVINKPLDRAAAHINLLRDSLPEYLHYDKADMEQVKIMNYVLAWVLSDTEEPLKPPSAE